MIIIIDAYNVLKQKSNTSYVSTEEITLFLKLLVEYADKKGHSLVAIFDGGPYHWPHEHTIGNVTVIHSGTRLSADDIIKRCLDSAEPHNTVLATSDRELCIYASDHGVPSIDSVDFARLVESNSDYNVMRVVKSQQPVKRMREQGLSEFDQLMEKASQVMIYKDEDISPTSPAPHKGGKKISKQEKKLQRVVKKL